MTRRIVWPAGGSDKAALSDTDDGQAAPANGQRVATIADVPALTIPQPAIGNVPTGPIPLLVDVSARAGALTTTMNALLAELRAAGVIAP